MKIQDLDPCPFCGGKAEKKENIIWNQHPSFRRFVCACGQFFCRLNIANTNALDYFQIMNEELGFEIFVNVFDKERACDIRIYRLLSKEEREKGAVLKFTDYSQLIEDVPIIAVQEAHEYLIRWVKLQSFQ